MPRKLTDGFLFLIRQLAFARSLLLLVAYSCLLAGSLYAAYLLRFDFDIPRQAIDYLSQCGLVALWLIPLEVILLFFFGQFGVLLSYFRIPDLYRVLLALSVSSATSVILWYCVQLGGWQLPVPPRGVILGNFINALFLLSAFRMALRVLRERFMHPERNAARVQRVAIAGAGDVGAQVAAELIARNGLGMKPVVFLDDDRSKWRRRIHGVPVVDNPDSLPFIRQKYGIESVVIAMPNASVKRVRDIVEIANEYDIRAEIVPSYAELTSGQVKASRVRPVEIEDLLGRPPVTLDSAGIRRMIEEQVVLITGAGGSIGSELARQIASYNPKRLILVEQSEIGLFNLESSLADEGYTGITLPLVANICDQPRMREVFGRYRPTLVFHAAAHKHVPIMERQPEAALLNNAFGTAHLADIASEMQVDRFVFVSTDKAINPTSAMGASKRLAELYIQAKSHQQGNCTKFMAVRFGNVLNSSGSVIPVFRKQIAKGGPVTVTHPEVTRYFMTIPEAVGLVLQCGVQGSGGEIFVLDMGTPVKIIDLARQLIRLSGFRPEIDIDIKFVGLRPGEKLYEELRHNGEHHVETTHPRIFRFAAEARAYDQIQGEFEKVGRELPGLERNQVKALIKDFVPEYSPYFE